MHDPGPPDPPAPVRMCFWHGEEPLHPTDYRTCFECGHTWRTREEWVASVHQMCRDMGWPVVDDSPMCTYCSHDF